MITLPLTLRFLSTSSDVWLIPYVGPGCSSVGGGAFTELGPFYPTGDGRGLRRNSMSWNRGMRIKIEVFGHI